MKYLPVSCKECGRPWALSVSGTHAVRLDGPFESRPLPAECCPGVPLDVK